MIQTLSLLRVDARIIGRVVQPSEAPPPGCERGSRSLAAGSRPVCSARRGVLTLISVPLYVRSGSVSAHLEVDWFRAVFRFFRVGWAGVAQLVEHLICNQRVGGSNPFASST